MENFKHLVWAAVVVLAMFLFRKHIPPLFQKLEEVTLPGPITIKMSNSDIKKLKLAEEKYLAEIQKLEEEISAQLTNSIDVKNQLNKLAEEIKDCTKSKPRLDAIKNLSANFNVKNKQLLNETIALKNNKWITKTVKAR